MVDTIFKNLRLRTELLEAMQGGRDTTLYALDGHFYRGQITEVGLFWVSMLIEVDGHYSSWLIRLNYVTGACAFHRAAADVLGCAPSIQELDDDGFAEGFHA